MPNPNPADGVAPLVVDDWLSTLLAGSAALVAALPDGAGSVWPHPAPKAANYPFVTYEFLGGGDRIDANSAIVMSQGPWLIRVYGQPGSWDPLIGPAAAVHAAIHRAGGSHTMTVGGVDYTFALNAQREGTLREREPDEAGVFLVLGGQYRIWWTGS